MIKQTITIVLLVGSSVFAAADIGQYRNRPAEWFSTDEGKQVVSNIISWQNANGGWWKAYDPAKPRPAHIAPSTEPNQIPGDDTDSWHRTSTIDNNATWSEMRVLARAVTFAKRDDANQSFERGLKFLFDAQYPTGGWPQRFPIEKNYGRYVTFNDNAMLGVMLLMRDIFNKQEDFTFVDDATRDKCKAAFDQGVEYILKSQIRTPMGLTVWCQQHDPETFAPMGARKFELASLSGDESAGILIMLMQIPNPDERVKASIGAGVAWYEKSKLTGIRVEKTKNPASPHGVDVAVVQDPSAEPIWARFYDIETNKPFFCDRDGVKKWSLAEIGKERQSGYAWHRPWGKPVLAAYEKWKAK